MSDIGICQWFHYQDDAVLEQAIALLDELGCNRLRTGISWADFHRPGGKQWYQRQMQQLAEADLDVLISLWHTPPSISESGSCSGPPQKLEDFAGFVWEVVQEYGDYFDSIEIWNEPNNRIKWNFKEHDPGWTKFGRLLRLGAAEARRWEKRTVLGGIIPVDPAWLRLMDGQDALEELDVIAFHAFPGMWWLDHHNWDWASHWKGWPQKVELLQPFLEDREVWVTETGLATWEVHEKREARMDEQRRRLRQAAAAPVDRLYWYSLMDLDPSRPCVEMTEDGRVEENEYHMGLVSHDGSRKPAFFEMQRILSENDTASAARTAAGGRR